MQNHPLGRTGICKDFGDAGPSKGVVLVKNQNAGGNLYIKIKVLTYHHFFLCSDAVASKEHGLIRNLF